MLALVVFMMAVGVVVVAACFLGLVLHLIFRIALFPLALVGGLIKLAVLLVAGIAGLAALVVVGPLLLAGGLLLLPLLALVGLVWGGLKLVAFA
jgi:hypothetical protein